MNFSVESTFTNDSTLQVFAFIIWGLAMLSFGVTARLQGKALLVGIAGSATAWIVGAALIVAAPILQLQERNDIRAADGRVEQLVVQASERYGIEMSPEAAFHLVKEFTAEELTNGLPTLDDVRYEWVEVTNSSGRTTVVSFGWDGTQWVLSNAGRGPVEELEVL